MMKPVVVKLTRLSPDGIQKIQKVMVIPISFPNFVNNSFFSRQSLNKTKSGKTLNVDEHKSHDKNFASKTAKGQCIESESIKKVTSESAIS